MRHELDELLVSRYPHLYRRRRESVDSSPMSWGFAVGDGWFDIIDCLSAELCSEWLSASREFERLSKSVGKAPWPGAPAVTPGDVEAARAAMEDAASRIPVAMQVKEKFGTLRFYVSGADDRAHALISLASAMSARVCERCGRPGSVGGQGWISCLCDRCRESTDDGDEP